MQILGSCTRRTESEAQWVGLSHLKFKKLSADSDGGLVKLNQVFSTGVIFTLHNLGEECYCHLVVRGQGCGSTSFNARDSPHPQQTAPQNSPAPDVHCVKVEKFCTKSFRRNFLNVGKLSRQKGSMD